MAKLMLEDAILATGRTPETIERWIMSGKVDAERAGSAWLIDLSSLLNVAAAEEPASNGNGHSGHDQDSPIDRPRDEIGGVSASTEALADTAVLATPRGDNSASTMPREDRALANVVAPDRSDASYTVEVATTAIAALNTRLEQAMIEIDRLQDERLKLALQLGYAQSQLKMSNDQLKALSAPAELSPLARFWRRLLGRGER